MKKNYIGIFLSGDKLYSSDVNTLLGFFEENLKKSLEMTKVFTPNPEQIVLAMEDEVFAKTLGSGDILIPDGIGLVIASKILAKQGKAEAMTERITGVDVSVGLLEIARRNNYKVMIIGGKEYHDAKYGQWKVTEVKNQTSFNTKNTIWWLEGYEDVKFQVKEESEHIAKSIELIKPDIVFVAFGAPYQEQWIIDNKRQLEKSGVKISMVVGGTFDMLLGKMKRAPKFVQTIGLEWLFRLIQQPWRWKRQLKLVYFVKLVVQESLK